MENTTGTETNAKAHDRRAETSPANGAKSKGPKTESGKRRSSANSLRHGLYSREIVLATESQSEYDALRKEFLDSFAPATVEEHELVIDMVHARWRMRRVERHEKGLMNLEMSRAMRDAPSEFEAMDAVTLEALAIQRLSATPVLENIHRMAQRLERTYFRSREALLKLQRERGAVLTVRDEPTSPPPTGWRRWFPILALFVVSLLRRFTGNRHRFCEVLSHPAA